MISIRKRISRPYLAIIIALPICITLLFNQIVSFSSKKQAEEDLLNAVLQISQNIDVVDTKTLHEIMRSQSHTSSAELVALDPEGKPLYWLKKSDSFVTDDLALLAYENSLALDQDEIGMFTYNSETYYIAYFPYKFNTLQDRIIYLSQGLAIDDFVSTVNLVLISISAIITILALLVSRKLTNIVAAPIERLTALVEDMDSNELIQIKDKSNSLELLRLTEEINSLNQRIYNYNQSQRKFLHDASHELRTPLMNIQGYADGIKMGIFPNSKETAHLISEQCKRLTKLVDSLLKLARAENFDENSSLEDLDLSESVLDLLHGYRGLALSSNIKLIENITPEIFVNANCELLQESIGNILSNAIRYAHSYVKISLIVQGEEAVITIEDDGDGISDIDNIFARFAKGEGGNFGLGLSIAKTSVDKMKGNIKAYNRSGAIFEIRLKAIKL